MNPLIALLFLLQDEAKAREAVEAAAAAMKDADAVTFDLVQTQMGVETTNRAKLAFKRPNLARLDYDDGLIVLDGKTYWYYAKKANQYMKQPQSKETAGILAEPVSGLFFDKSAGKVLEKAKDFSIKKEKLDEKTECDVVGFKAPAGGEMIEWKLWIDDKKMIRRAVMTMSMEGEAVEQTFTFTAHDLAPKLAADAFAFTPPKDATESSGGDEDLEKSLLAEGADAPDFTATDLDGKEVKLSTFRGKTVLVNFWFYN